MTHNRPPTRPHITLRATLQRSADARSASYKAYMRKVVQRINSFRAVIGGEARLEFIADTIHRLALVTGEDSPLLSCGVEGTEPPDYFDARTVRCTNGIALLHWLHEDVLVVLEGAPSLAVGGTVRVTKRTTETAKMRAGQRARALWAHPDIKVTVACVGTGAGGLPSIVAAVLNAAYFSITPIPKAVDETETDVEDAPHG